MSFETDLQALLNHFREPATRRNLFATIIAAKNADMAAQPIPINGTIAEMVDTHLANHANLSQAYPPDDESKRD